MEFFQQHAVTSETSTGVVYLPTSGFLLSNHITHTTTVITEWKSQIAVSNSNSFRGFGVE